MQVSIQYLLNAHSNETDVTQGLTEEAEGVIQKKCTQVFGGMMTKQLIIRVQKQIFGQEQDQILMELLL